MVESVARGKSKSANSYRFHYHFRTDSAVRLGGRQSRAETDRAFLTSDPTALCFFRLQNCRDDLPRIYDNPYADRRTTKGMLTGRGIGVIDEDGLVRGKN